MGIALPQNGLLVTSLMTSEAVAETPNFSSLFLLVLWEGDNSIKRSRDDYFIIRIIQAHWVLILALGATELGIYHVKLNQKRNK